MVKEEVENDLTIRDLLCVLLIFLPPPSSPPEVETISTTSRYPEFIRYQYHSYCHLLRQYLYHKYAPNARKAAERYSRLLVIIEKVATFRTAVMSTVACKVDFTRCSHLLAEIYFLKDGTFGGLGGGGRASGSNNLNVIAQNNPESVSETINLFFGANATFGDVQENSSGISEVGGEVQFSPEEDSQKAGQVRGDGGDDDGDGSSHSVVEDSKLGITAF